MSAPINKPLNCRDASGRAFMGVLTKLGWCEVRGARRVLCDPPASWADPHSTIEYRHGIDPWWIRKQIAKQLKKERT